MKQKITVEIEIDLDKIPDWVNYITFDEDGMWVHEGEPYIKNSSNYFYSSDLKQGDMLDYDCINVMNLCKIERNNDMSNNTNCYNKEHQLRTYKSE